MKANKKKAKDILGSDWINVGGIWVPPAAKDKHVTVTGFKPETKE